MLLETEYQKKFFLFNTYYIKYMAIFFEKKSDIRVKKKKETGPNTYMKI